MGARQEAQTFFYLREISEGERDMGTWGGGEAQVQQPCGVGDQSGVCVGEGRGRPRLMAGRKVGESLRLGLGGWPWE